MVPIDRMKLQYIYISTLFLLEISSLMLRNGYTLIGGYGRLKFPPTNLNVKYLQMSSTRVSSESQMLPKIIPTSNVPIHLFCSTEVEPDAIAQLVGLASSVIPVGFVASMPDVHLGKGATIGSVFASDRYICPNAVGVDIGCGMSAVPTNLHKDNLSLEQKLLIQSGIKSVIPTGSNFFKKPQPGVLEALDKISNEIRPTQWLLDNLLIHDKPMNQIGTLGGGNHFIEVLHDETGMVWLMLHSGSRNTGKETATYYDRLAQKHMKAIGAKSPPGLAYVDTDSEIGQNYLNDMVWCQKYAFENRRQMMSQLIQVFCDITGATPDLTRLHNVHHNFCECKTCTYTDPKSGKSITKDLWITRKGATSAQAGQIGIIPGSMGVGSYIVTGRGNKEAWESCSHGAGRLMSRTRAKSIIKQSDFIASMEGIVCDTNKEVIDEAPAAYKNLETVMNDQKDLVDITHRLLPLINVKGFE